MNDEQDRQRRLVEQADRLVERAAMRRPPAQHRPIPIREIIHRTEPNPMLDIEKKTTYSVKEAAELTGRSTETIRRHCASGKLPAAGGGRGDTWRISRVELADWWRRQGGGRLFPDTDADK
jgi:excisionase family DNA binding protein